MPGKEYYYLGLDQGTTGTTALLLDKNWNQAARGYCEVTQYYPRSGWVEHDPVELYQTLLKATGQALAEAKAEAGQIRCIGICNQGETVVLWNKETGEPVYPAIVWQDRRTAQYADKLNEKLGSWFYERTELQPDAYFGATKIQWILQNVPDAQHLLKQHKLAAGTLDTWMIWKLTGGKVFVTDCVTASRTCLMNLKKRSWDQDILDLLEIPLEILPEIRENACEFGLTAPDCFLGERIPITGSIIDQQAALFGQGCISPGGVKTTYGTGCFMLMNTGEKPLENADGLLTTLGWVHNKKAAYALDGGVYISGAATQWLKNGIHVIESVREADELALSLNDNGGLYFVPAFTGLAAPYWDSYARGMMIGITAGITPAHIARATLEATAYQVSEILKIMEKSSGLCIDRMRVDGGSTASRFLMQFQADLLGIPIEIPVISETTALGGAYMGALGMGDFSSLEEPLRHWKRQTCYEPQMDEATRDALVYDWHRAVERSLGWAVARK